MTEDSAPTQAVDEAPPATGPAEPTPSRSDDTPVASPEPETATAALEPEVTTAALVPEAATAAPEPEAATAAPESPSPEPPRPAPRPPIPSPAALAARKPPAAATIVAEPVPLSKSVTFGRVDDAGTVYVTDAGSERAVGTYPGASADEALQYFARKYDELYGQVDLLAQRLQSGTVPVKEASESLKSLRELATTPDVVGDLAALRTRLDEAEALRAQRAEVEAAERAEAKAHATAEREQLVAEAEKIAATPPEKMQWRQSSERVRALLEEWKAHQRNSARLDKSVESELWHRFSHARTAFDKARRSYFAELEVTRADAKRTKEALVKEAEAMATSRDWNATARAYKQLMQRWRAAGRASREDDDALWERFKTAQDSFFNAKDEVVAAEEAEYAQNLAVKEKLLAEAQKLLPISNLTTAKNALRSIQDRWDQAGRVPRADIDRMEQGLRRVEGAVRDAEDKKWSATNPEVVARASSMVSQLEDSLAGLRADLAKAQAAGNSSKAAKIEEKIAAQEAWLTQARSGLE